MLKIGNLYKLNDYNCGLFGVVEVHLKEYVPNKLYFLRQKKSFRFRIDHPIFCLVDIEFYVPPGAPHVIKEKLIFLYDNKKYSISATESYLFEECNV